MTRDNVFFDNIYIKILRRSIIELTFIDIVLFSIVGNIEYFSFIMKPMKIGLLFFLVQNVLLKSNYTRFLELIFCISATDIKKPILINFFFNNIFYLLTSLILLMYNVTNINSIFDQYVILNLLIIISFLIKYKVPLYNVKEKSIRDTLRIITYYSSYAIVVVIPHNISTLLLILAFFFFSINYFNRTFNFYDI